jgi:hypothetical protein
MKVPLSEYCKRFGQISIEKGYVTPEQLKEALSEQVDDDLAGRPHRPIGSIFFSKNWMTAKQTDEVLNEMFGVSQEETPSGNPRR